MQAGATAGSKPSSPYKWIKYAIYLWGFRLGLSSIGMAAPFIALGLRSFCNYFAFSTSLFRTITALAEPYAEGSWASPMATAIIAIFSFGSAFPSQVSELNWNSSFIFNPKVFESIKSAGEPALIMKAPIYSTDALIKFLSTSAVPNVIARGKVSKFPAFKYISHDRAWSPNEPTDFLGLYEERELSSLSQISSKKLGISSCTEGSSADCENNKYFWYVTYGINPDGEEELPLERELSPIFPQIIRSVWRKQRDIDEQDLNFRSNLWLSSSGVHVPFHYDMDHNIFHQIHGEKQFLVMEPSASKLLQTYSVLHPFWRQSRVDLVDTGGKCNDENKHKCLNIVWNEGSSGESGVRQVIEGKITGYIPLFDGSKKNKICDNQNEVCSDEWISYETFTVRVWKITLKRGDLFYLPPFYFHQVSTKEQHIENVDKELDFSLSWSMWRKSSYSKIYDKMIKQADLPYFRKDSMLKKLEKFATSIYFALVEIREDLPSVFDEYIVRFGLKDELVRNAVDDWKSGTFTNGAIDAWFCENASLDGEKFNGNVRRSGLKLSSLLQSSDLAQIISLRPAANRTSDELNLLSIRRLILFDFIDETLSSILGSQSSPESSLNFAVSCLLRTFKSYRADKK